VKHIAPHDAARLAQAVALSARFCIDCESPVTGRKVLCAPCKRTRNLIRCAAYHAAHKPDPEKVKAAWEKWRAANRDKDRASKVAGRQRWEVRYPDRRAASIAKTNAKQKAARLAWLASPEGLATTARRLSRKKAKAAASARNQRDRKFGKMSFPYIVASRPEALDYLALNALVPQGLPGREDAVQSMALAVLEGRTTLAALQSDRSAVRAFCRGHIKGNFEAGGYAVSLSQPRADGRSWDDMLPDNGERAWT
jgi:hypothetical protein